jgi:hypothetical protein
MSVRHSVVDLKSKEVRREYTADLRLSRILAGSVSNQTTPRMLPSDMRQQTFELSSRTRENPPLSVESSGYVDVHKAASRYEVFQSENIELERINVDKTQFDSKSGISGFPNALNEQVESSTPGDTEVTSSPWKTFENCGTQYECKGDFRMMLSDVASHPDCPGMLRDILENISSLNQQLPEDESPGDEEANAFDRPTPAMHVDAIVVDDIIATPEIATEEGTPQLLSPPNMSAIEATPILTSVDITPRLSPTSVPSKQVGGMHHVSTIPEDSERESGGTANGEISEPLPRLRINFRAVSALTRLQKRIRQRYNDQKEKLIKDLGL